MLKDCHVGDLGSLENGEGGEGASDPIAEDEHRMNTGVRHRSGRVLDSFQVGGQVERRFVRSTAIPRP